jgi:hypothetical protein
MPTERSIELRALAQRLADGFPPIVVAVVLTGSVSRGVADDLSDIEMLVLTDGPLTLEEAFALAEAAGLRETESWGDQAAPTRRVHGYLEGQSIETVWWSRALAEESFAKGGSAEALANGVPLRGGACLASVQDRLADFPDSLVAERCEQAAEAWGGFSPAGILTIARDDTALARMEWIVDSASACCRSSTRSTASTLRRRSASRRGSPSSPSSRSGSRNESKKRSRSRTRAKLS